MGGSPPGAQARRRSEVSVTELGDLPFWAGQLVHAGPVKTDNERDLAVIEAIRARGPRWIAAEQADLTMDEILAEAKAASAGTAPAVAPDSGSRGERRPVGCRWRERELPSPTVTTPTAPATATITAGCRILAEAPVASTQIPCDTISAVRARLNAWPVAPGRM